MTNRPQVKARRGELRHAEPRRFAHRPKVNEAEQKRRHVTADDGHENRDQ